MKRVKNNEGPTNLKREIELAILLERLGILEEFQRRLNCDFCGEWLTKENFGGASESEDASVMVCCDGCRDESSSSTGKSKKSAYETVSICTFHSPEKLFCSRPFN